MVCVIIRFPIKGYAISYHSDLKCNVQIENIESLICFRYVLNNLIDIPTIYRYIREYNFILKYLKRYIAKSWWLLWWAHNLQIQQIQFGIICYAVFLVRYSLPYLRRCVWPTSKCSVGLFSCASNRKIL